jgi:hypothetical protein
MRALFECRLEHIGWFDWVKVECACGRTVLLEASAFNGLPNYTHIVDLKRRLRCDSCGERGRVMVSVARAADSARRG